MYQVSDINTWKVYQVARKTNISGGGGRGGGGLPKKGEEVGQFADLRGGFGCF